MPLLCGWWVVLVSSFTWRHQGAVGLEASRRADLDRDDHGAGDRVGLAGGYYGDRWLGTAPWLMLLGLLLGIVAGFVSMLRSVKAAERRMKNP